MSSLMTNGGFNRSTIEHDLQPGNGPRVVSRAMSSEYLTAFGQYDGKQPDGEYQISLDESMLSSFEKVFSSENVSEEVKQAKLLGVVSTLLHEYTHHGTGGGDFEEEEMGHKFERDAYGQELQPDDIMQLMQVRILKTDGKLVSPNDLNNVIEKKPGSIDRSVIPTLPKPE